jgi:hypothetical protein
MMQYKILFYVLVVLIALNLAVFGPRIIKGIKLKQDKVNTYAIQNVKTNRCIRPYNAGFQDNNKIILYDLNNWECITWQFIGLNNDTYLLKNLYTEKTFQSVTDAVEGATMWQKPLGGSNQQYWEFLKQDDGTYLIRLKGTELYLTAKSEEQNADIVLKPLQNSTDQQWKLIEQHPIV